MNDVFDTAKRSVVMSRIRGRGNLTTELKLVAAFKQHGVIGWRRHVLLKPRVAPEERMLGERPPRLSVRPDFIFRHQKVAVFVDGCFWHGCPAHATKPTTNSEFWTKKLSGNAQRDRRATNALLASGWHVLRVWEHELASPDVVVERVKAVLSRS
jgi:DNA mismatch endonuclease, patch repair protein